MSFPIFTVTVNTKIYIIFTHIFEYFCDDGIEFFLVGIINVVSENL